MTRTPQIPSADVADDDVLGRTSDFAQLTNALEHPGPYARQVPQLYRNAASALMGTALMALTKTDPQAPTRTKALATVYGRAAGSRAAAAWQSGILFVTSHTAARWLRTRAADDPHLAEIAPLHEALTRLEETVWDPECIVLRDYDRPVELTTACMAVYRVAEGWARHPVRDSHLAGALKTLTAFAATDQLAVVHGRLVLDVGERAYRERRGAGLGEALAAILPTSVPSAGDAHR